MMKRAAPYLAVLLAAAAGPAAAAVKATATAHAAITDQAGVRMAWTMAMPSVQGGSSGASFLSANPSMTMGTMMAPVTPVIRREDASGQPVTAPATFEVASGGGASPLIVRTAGSSEIRITGDGVIVGGALLGGSAASIGVGRELAATPGGPLVVLVQYN